MWAVKYINLDGKWKLHARHYYEWSVKWMIFKTHTKCVPNEAAAFFSLCKINFVCDSAMIKFDVTGMWNSQNPKGSTWISPGNTYIVSFRIVLSFLLLLLIKFNAFQSWSTIYTYKNMNLYLLFSNCRAQHVYIVTILFDFNYCNICIEFSNFRVHHTFFWRGFNGLSLHSMWQHIHMQIN